mmetsp:Transcript_4817/g.12255  ORF Transcript_4817/g.12255 Transcript_4817/m.12255 type:complete len:123 (-) Transcript_4817:67-435(-)
MGLHSNRLACRRSATRICREVYRSKVLPASLACRKSIFLTRSTLAKVAPYRAQKITVRRAAARMSSSMSAAVMLVLFVVVVVVVARLDQLEKQANNNNNGKGSKLQSKKRPLTVNADGSRDG